MPAGDYDVHYGSGFWRDVLEGQRKTNTLDNYRNGWYPNAWPYQAQPCPSCGHCPTCGRGTAPRPYFASATNSGATYSKA
jgi:hypothetical protein